ncbi:PTS sugar transporter subunit IIC, partial [Salmonella enterica subsp. enterica serovar Kentucky]|nr:PTS sugar transporter subunit IIC [Salmonella enterica subsp. enterica serovar Kentucky]
MLIGTQLFCHFQANGTLYFDGCYKTGKADNSLLCTNLGLLTGLVLGDMETGIVMGATLELAFIGSFSVGASLPPDVVTG